MEILISIAAKIVEYTVAPIRRQAGYLIFYKDNLKELMHSIEELEGVREQIKHFVEEERRNGKEIEIVVQTWLDKVDDIIEEAKKLHEDPHHVNVECSKWSLPNLRSRHQLGRNAKKLARNVVEVQGKGNFDRVGYLPPLDGVGLTFAVTGNEKLKSRKGKKEDIVLALRDPKVTKIGVYGLSGVGKTTLVREVAKQVKDDKLFDAVVMASVSQTLDLERIQDEIADLLGLRFEEKSTVGRASRLCERLKKEKTILIILDDIWVRIDLEKLGIPSKDNHKGCKLLLISRNQDMLQKMESEKDFRLEVLNEQETWSLFEAMVGDVVKDPSLQSIATRVAKKCAGLPILVVTVARALKSKNIYYWKDALNQLESVGNEEINGIAYSAIKFSYNWLEGDEMKTLFLLCGVVGTSSHVEDLLNYGFGLGIFKHINTMEDARNRLCKMISDLRASCLLLEDDISATIRMHDIVQEVAISIASRDQFAFVMKRNAKLEDSLTKDFLKRCTQIILNHCYIQKLPERLDCPYLKFFLLDSFDNSSLQIPHSFFEGMRNLEVLNLTGMILSWLPTSLVSLTKLKTLCLVQCALGNMAGMGALKNLEIVCYAYSSMENFPSEIRQLTHLRRLDLENSGIELMPSNIISNLTKLEELCISNTSIKWEVENSAKQGKNASLAELRHLTSLTALEIQIREAWILPRDLMFEKLERYKIVIGDKWEWSDEYGASRLLKLKLGTSIHLEHGIKALIKRVEDLYLDEINGISNVLYQLNGEGFPLLKHLHIQNNAKIQHIINSMERNQTYVFFPNLETIILHNLSNLEKICHGPLTIDSFGKLRLIKVKSCNQLEFLFSILMVKDLFQLFEIEVSECNSIKTIVFMECMNGDTTSHKIEFFPLRSLTLQNLPAIGHFCSNELTSSTTKLNYNSWRTSIPTSFFSMEVVFPNLETLKLSSINLNKVWDDDQLSIVSSLQNLANLIVEDCHGLKYLFSSFMVDSLKNLKQLEISKCHMMEEIIATKGRNSGAAINEVRFSNLKRIKINDMENLKTVWHNQFEGLKTLEVSNCEKPKNIFPSYCMQKALRSIETLKEIVAKKDEPVEGTVIFELNRLTSLDLTNLFELKGFYGGIHTLDCRSLKELNVSNCKKLKLFDIQSNRCQESSTDDQLHFSTLQPLFKVEEVIGNFEELTLDYADANMILQQQFSRDLFYKLKRLNLSKSEDDQATFPHWFLQNIPNLEGLIVRWSSFKEIFYDETPTGREGGHTPRLKELTLSGLPKLQHICKEGCPIHPILEVLDFLFVGDCSSLRNLVPSSITFCHLTYLEMKDCNGLISLISSSTARSLVKLITMKLRECNSLEEIVTEEVDETKSEIAFSNLEILELECLPRLNSFSSSKCFLKFPLLEEVVVRQCPRMKIFSPRQTSTPMLKKVQTITEETEEWRWEGDINGTINKMFLDKDAFCSFEHLELSKYPELKESWYYQFGHKIFCNLKSLVVHKCDFLSSFLLSSNLLRVLSNLEMLEVSDCDSLEAVFDLNDMDERETLVEETIPLKEIILSNLPKLLHIWKQDSQEIVSFDNSGDNHTGECHELKISEASGIEKIRKEDRVDIQRQQPLFLVKKVLFPKLETMTVSNVENLNTVWHSTLTPNSFRRLKTLEVRICASLETLTVSNCNSVEVIFQLSAKEMHCEEDMTYLKKRRDCDSLSVARCSTESSTQIKIFWLYKLEQLKHIWTDNSMSDLLVQELEYLIVVKCSSLIRLAPPSISFINLITLEVRDCKGLIYLMTSSTAKSLVHLTSLTVENCEMIEVVVMIDEGESEEEITFRSLEYLHLNCLSSFKSFCPGKHTFIFPSLEELTVKECPKMQNFSSRVVIAPKWKKAIEEGP